MLAWMGRNGLALEVQADQRLTGVQLQLFTDSLMGYRVVMVLILHVIIDVDLHGLDIDIGVGPAR